MQAPTISVIIPVYNRIAVMTRTLRSLQAQTMEKSSFEVIIADDGSTEDVQGVLATFPDLSTTYCRQPDLGFRVAAARNLGIAHASGELLVFNDNGMLLSPTALARHAALHAGRDDLVLLGYMHGTSFTSDAEAIRALLDAHSLEHAIAEMQRIGGMGDGREGYMTRFGRDLSQWYIPWLGLWGGHFSVGASFLRKHGIAFDERFTRWGGEDHDFGIQLCRAGAHYQLCSDIRVVHYPAPGHIENDVGNERFRAMYEKVKQYITNKHRTEDVMLWRQLDSSANDPAERERVLRMNHQAKRSDER